MEVYGREPLVRTATPVETANIRTLPRVQTLVDEHIRAFGEWLTTFGARMTCSPLRHTSGGVRHDGSSVRISAAHNNRRYTTQIVTENSEIERTVRAAGSEENLEASPHVKAGTLNSIFVLNRSRYLSAGTQ